MTPGALPAANLRLPASSQAPCRTTARTPHARVPPSTNPLEHAQHHARNCPWPALQTAAHCAQPHQHLHSITSTRIARALACARARLPACVHPPRPADQPHLLPRDALPCLSTCVLYARHTTNVLTLRARSQRLGHSCTCPASRAQRVGSRTFARIAWVPAFLCRVTQAASAHITGWQQSTAAHC